MQGEELGRVVLVDFPLRVAGRAYRHREALLREFAIIAFGGGEQADVPKRLVEIAKILEIPDITSFIRAQGAEPALTDPAAFGAYMNAERAKWAKVIKTRNIKID